MCVKPKAIEEIPQETQRIAKAAFPKGNIYMRMRDTLGSFFCDEQFAELFAQRGQPGYSPWRLALVCIMQYVENFSDRQAADAVRSRIDWKYALSLDLTDSGFDYSVLSEFRTRLIDSGKEQHLLEAMLTCIREKGLPFARGKQRTDSSQVLAAIRKLNRIERVGETLRAALNRLAVEAPQWLTAIAPQKWYDRYEKRMEEYHFPKEQTARKQLEKTIGLDGLRLLDAIYSPDAPQHLREFSEVEILRQTWIQQFYFINDQIELRPEEELPPASIRLQSPYDSDARYSVKRSTEWIGYKVHFTETCDDDSPHLITSVQTTLAPVQDISMTEAIHSQLAQKGLLPKVHLADAGYVSAELLVQSDRDYQIQLIGPAKADGSWQAKENQGYSVDQFQIDWQLKSVTCPQGEVTPQWRETTDQRGKPVIHVKFPRSTCQSCQVRSLCTKSDGRSLAFRPQSQHLALVSARQQQQTEAWKQQYTKRAGIEGTLSQGVRTFGLRQARYIGFAKTHLQHILTACAINLSRIDNWMTGVPLAKTRISRFQRLQVQAA